MATTPFPLPPHPTLFPKSSSWFRFSRGGCPYGGGRKGRDKEAREGVCRSGGEDTGQKTKEAAGEMTQAHQISAVFYQTIKIPLSLSPHSFSRLLGADGREARRALRGQGRDRRGAPGRRTGSSQSFALHIEGLAHGSTPFSTGNRPYGSGLSPSLGYILAGSPY